MSDFRFLVVLVGLFVVVSGGLFGAALFFDKASCVANARAMGVEYRWSAFSACIVKTSSGWVPLKNVRALQ